MNEDTNVVIDPEHRFVIDDEVRIVIIEEPASHSIRFRYSSEGRTAGSLQGAHSTEQYETFPAVKIEGYTGLASIIVILVTNRPPYKVHPHRLVGEKCVQGVYYLAEFTTNKENPTVLEFVKIGIQCVKKKEIGASLSEKERLRIDPFKRGFHHKDDDKLDLGCVRLCFIALLRPYQLDPKRKIQLQPVVSQPIYNKKFPATLSIIELSDTSSPTCGGKKIMIFCDKVSKDDIRVRFFENDTDWVGWGIFQQHNVHRQVGIAFKTPEYRLQGIHQAVEVFIQLERPSDMMRSEPMVFQYVPDVNNIKGIMKQKEAKMRHTKNLFDMILDSVDVSTSQNPAQNDDNNQQQLTQVPTISQSQSENDDYIQQLQHAQVFDDVQAWYCQNPPRNDEYYCQLQDMVVSMQHIDYHGNIQPTQNLQNVVLEALPEVLPQALPQALPQTLPHVVSQNPQNSSHPQQMQCAYPIQHSQEQFNQQPQYDHEMQQHNVPGPSRQFNFPPQQPQYDQQPFEIQPGFQNNQYQNINAEGFPVPDGNVELSQPCAQPNPIYSSPSN